MAASGFNPAEIAAALGAPALVLQGGRDYQVTHEDFQGWKAAVSRSDDMTFKLFPSLNHHLSPEPASRHRSSMMSQVMSPLRSSTRSAIGSQPAGARRTIERSSRM
jgi:alpha-beta hydrolase superfamily lysophospholipase